MDRVAVGRLWGVTVVASRTGPLPPGTETPLAGFTELAGQDGRVQAASELAQIPRRGVPAHRRCMPAMGPEASPWSSIRAARPVWYTSVDTFRPPSFAWLPTGKASPVPLHA